MGKSQSEKKIDNSLMKKIGLNEELDELDSDTDDSKTQEDLEKERKAEERRKMASEMKKELSKLKKKESKDKEFCREMYKELAARGLTMLAVMQEEVELNPRARDVETAGSLMNSITSTLDSLRNIDEVEEKFVIEREKLDTKRAVAIGNDRMAAITAAGSSAVVSSMADMVKEIRKAQKQDQIIEIEVDEKEE